MTNHQKKRAQAKPIYQQMFSPYTVYSKGSTSQNCTSDQHIQMLPAI